MLSSNYDSKLQNGVIVVKLRKANIFSKFTSVWMYLLYSLTSPVKLKKLLSKNIKISVETTNYMVHDCSKILLISD